MQKILIQIAAERRGFVTTIQPLSECPIGPFDLPLAAAAMALLGDEDFAEADLPRQLWPWKLLPDHLGTSRANLIRSAALLLAAIQRIDRLAADKHKGK